MATVGVVIGKFWPFHVGHAYMIWKASLSVDKVHVLLTYNSTQDWLGLTPEDRIISLQRWVSGNLNNVIVHSMDDSDMPDAVHSDEDVSNIWSEFLVLKFPDVTHFIGSEDYIDMMANHTNKIGIIIDKEREENPISGTQIRNDLYNNFSSVIGYQRIKLCKRICVVGAESSGKSTLVNNIAAHFNYNETEVHYNPVHSVGETARDFMGTLDITDEHFETFAIAHYHNVFLTINDSPFMVVDTDLNITKLYAQIYLGHNVPLVDLIQAKEKYDHYIVLKPDVPFVQDGLRIHDEQKKRDEFYNQVLDYVIKSGVDYTIIDGEDFNIRTEKAISTVRDIMIDNNFIPIEYGLN